MVQDTRHIKKKDKKDSPRIILWANPATAPFLS